MTMTDSTTRMHPPARPKKAPSPRLTPRRSGRRLSHQSGGGDILSMTMMMGGGGIENNENDHVSSFHNSPLIHQPIDGNKDDKDLQQQAQILEMNNNSSSSPITSPNRCNDNNKAPLSPTTSSTTEVTLPNITNNTIPRHCLPSAGATHSSSNNDGINCCGGVVVSQQQEMDEEPLTPRNLGLSTCISSSDGESETQFTLTPPVNSPTPLVVSAKLLGNKVKKSTATKRRRPVPADDDYVSSSDEDDDSSSDNNNMVVPEGLSPSQVAREYWKQCYGSMQAEAQQQTSWSAKRVAPAKSCLSHSKQQINNSKRLNTAKIMLPPESTLLPSPPAGTPAGESSIFSTPRPSPEETCTSQQQNKCSHSKSVQFGIAQAAEYERDAPCAKFTPLGRFQIMADNKLEDDEEELEQIVETKENTSILAAWENDFDDLIDDDDDTLDDDVDDDIHDDIHDSNKEEACVESHNKSKKKHRDKKRRVSKKRRSEQKLRGKNNKYDRRRSTNFSPTNNDSQALYDPSSDIDVDMDITPESKKSTTVMNNLASLSMTSPKAAIGSPGNHLDGKSDIMVSSADKTTMSPVLARRLSDVGRLDPVPKTGESSCEGKTTQADAEEYKDEKTISDTSQPSTTPTQPTSTKIGLKCPAKLPKGTANIWDDGTENLTLLSPSKKWDSSTIFSNLAIYPSSLNLSNRSDEEYCDETLADSLVSWPSNTETVFVNGLTLFSKKMNLPDNDGGNCSIDSKFQRKINDMPDKVRDILQRVAQHEWRKLEIELCKNMTSEIIQLEQAIREKATVLGTLVVPARASFEPTRQQIAGTMGKIQQLEALIGNEKARKEQWQQRWNKALLQHSLVQMPLSHLAYHAIFHLSPVDVALTRDKGQAIFTSLLEGLETRLELPGCTETTIVQSPVAAAAHLAEEEANVYIENSHFFNLMLCSDTGKTIKLQEGLMGLLYEENFTNDHILQLATMLGRIDLLALSIQKLREEYKVSVLPLDASEQGENVVVVRIQLSQNLILNAFYKRSNAKSVFWSIPSNVSAQQDGKTLPDLLAPLSELATVSRSLEGTSSFLHAACDLVLQRIKEPAASASAKDD